MSCSRLAIAPGATEPILCPLSGNHISPSFSNRLVISRHKNAKRLLCCEIDPRFRELGEEMVCRAFLIQSLLKQLRLRFVAELPRVGSSGAGTGHLVVLDVLRR